MENDGAATVGVVVVSYRSEDVIFECLESLLASTGVRLRIVVVDNASPTDTADKIVHWANGKLQFQKPADSPLPDLQPSAKPIPITQSKAGETLGPLGPLTLIRSDVNLGFAGGVNVGLRALRDQVDWYWILNPDCVAPPDTAAAFVRAAGQNPGFSLMSSRTLYYARPDLIQTDGGQVDRRTGACRQISYGARAAETQLPNAQELDWVTGANMFVSPQFLAEAGLMEEDYFLYYEEVDWAHRRDGRPLALASDAVVYHHGGTTIGTGSVDRRPSPFANYFNHRNRIRFAKRRLGRAPLMAYLFGFAKAARLLPIGAFDEAMAIVAGMLELRPSAEIMGRISDPRAARLAFGRHVP